MGQKTKQIDLNMREKFVGTNEEGRGDRKVVGGTGQYSLLTRMKLSKNRFTNKENKKFRRELR